jgi:hypothetical protein
MLLMLALYIFYNVELKHTLSELEVPTTSVLYFPQIELNICAFIRVPLILLL